MKKTIWKYALEPRATLKMPQGAKVLTVQMQNGEPQLWALAAPDAPQMERRFVTYGTGHDMPENPGFAGCARASANLYDGWLHARGD